MQQTGEHRIGATREAVWRALNDPAVLAKCIEGCQSFEAVGENRYAAVVKARIGPVSAVFNADLEILEPDPPKAYSIAGQVKGGAAGFGRGAARVTLAEDGEVTLLRYEVEGSVGGKLVQVGQRLIDATARKMADDFFAAFAEQVAPGASQNAAAETPPPGSVTRASGSRWLLWAGAAVAIAAAVCLWLLRR